MNSTPSTLKDEARQLAKDFSDLADHAGQLATHSARLAGQGILKPGRNASRLASDRMRSAVHRGRELAESELDRCRTFARRKPVAIALMMGCAGALVALTVGAAAGCRQTHAEGDGAGE